MTYLAYYIYVIFILSAHHFCLCMTMVVWFVTREQMFIQVMLRILRRRSEG